MVILLILHEEAVFEAVVSATENVGLVVNHLTVHKNERSARMHRSRNIHRKAPNAPPPLEHIHSRNPSLVVRCVLLKIDPLV